MKNKILVVDDSVETTELFKAMLGDQGYDVSVANDGKAGLELTREIRPDLVILDVMMPEIDGYGVLKAIKEDPSLNDVEVIMLSAKSLEEDIQTGLDLGVCDYVAKPFHAELLIKRIQRLFNKKK